MYKYDLIFELECTKRKIEELVNKIDLNLSKCRKGSLLFFDNLIFLYLLNNIKILL